MAKSCDNGFSTVYSEKKIIHWLLSSGNIFLLTVHWLLNSSPYILSYKYKGTHVQNSVLYLQRFVVIRNNIEYVWFRFRIWILE